jgi:hypothetical protein
VSRPKKCLRLDEIVTEALKHIPPTVPEFKKILSFTPVTNIGKVTRYSREKDDRFSKQP